MVASLNTRLESNKEEEEGSLLSGATPPSPVAPAALQACPLQEREFFIDNLLVRIHFIIEMIRWTGLLPVYLAHKKLLPPRTLQ